MISANNLFIAKNDSKGIVYYVPTGCVKQMSPEDASVLSVVFSDYQEKKLSSQDMADFDDFIDKNLSKNGNKKLQPDSYGLDTTRHLFRIEIMMATYCNLSCKYCYADSGTYGREKSLMSSENIRNYLTALIPKHFDSVDIVMFFGGEPTLSPDAIEEACKFFIEANNNRLLSKLPIFTMVSNGILIDENLSKIISRYNIRTTISIDGPKEINDQLRVFPNGKGTFDLIMNGIKNLQNASAPLTMLEVTYTRRHFDLGYTKQDIRKYLNDRIGAVKVMIADCSGDSELAWNGHSPLPDMYEEVQNQRIAKVAAKLECTTFRDYNCGAGLDSLIIMPSGDLYPCHQFTITDDYKLGNAMMIDKQLFNNEIKEKMHSARRSRFINCSDCWARELCEECPATLLLFANPDSLEEYCIKNRSWIEELLLSIE